MSEHLAKVEARDGRSSKMVYTTEQSKLSRAQLAEIAGLEWQQEFETRHEDSEGLRVTAEGFRITVMVDGEQFKVEMRPSIIWESVAEKL